MRMGRVVGVTSIVVQAAPRTLNRRGFRPPYEWARESDWYWRTFRVPAAVLNSVLGYGTMK
jgi:hypothetical protein